MAYDEHTDPARFRGEPGFREEPDFRASPAGLGGAGIPAARHGVSAAALDDVFDDPDHGDPGRDRLAVHFAWEAVLLVGIAILGYLLFSQHRATVTGDSLQRLLVFGSAIGLLALAGAMSLRTGAVNLAVGPVAIASALFFAQHGNDGVVPTTLKAVALAAAVGAVIAVLVVGFHVPGWAGSLVAALTVIVWIQRHSGPVTVAGEYDPTDRALYYAGGFVILSLLAATLGTIKSVRRGVGRFRPVGDPALRRGTFAGFVTAAALVGSTVLAAVAGVLLAGLSPKVEPTLGLELTGIALGVAMLGGVSAFGRRGGVFGTVLATTAVALVIWFGEAAGWKLSLYAVAAATVAAGLVVTRLVETFGRPMPNVDEEEWTAEASTSWATETTGSWSATLPAQQTAANRPDPWPDDRWTAGR
ncbi:ribose/xylose/arabinose/galactoside ABC-type transport system permease subunit [Allocatelliglobosispora scoriae]|uniref:Ribose/xylose/arabinose/galactoside ABC-type transport system permease subunit n=1 Tax=Allocatelliglobosispora scoriae TaxID=643052 RepID=A0A841BQC5_9ACTN|nr:ABC transporter permease [Allocatelliglobosispora scoriae]MBB5871267.1 ribose/xylose/arabinose/galactoside ABC-type transport system permease subunit [Allocatelliglobosispora scoriae]